MRASLPPLTLGEGFLGSLAEEWSSASQGRTIAHPNIHVYGFFSCGDEGRRGTLKTSGAILIKRVLLSKRFA